MDLKLSEGGLEKYSPAETKLFHLLKKTSEPISSTELMDLFYNGKRKPIHGRTAMNVSLKRLMQKVEQNKETFRIVRTQRKGGEPIIWQIRTNKRSR